MSELNTAPYFSNLVKEKLAILLEGYTGTYRYVPVDIKLKFIAEDFTRITLDGVNYHLAFKKIPKLPNTMFRGAVLTNMLFRIFEKVAGEWQEIPSTDYRLINVENKISDLIKGFDETTGMPKTLHNVYADKTPYCELACPVMITAQAVNDIDLYDVILLPEAEWGTTLPTELEIKKVLKLIAVRIHFYTKEVLPEEAVEPYNVGEVTVPV